MAGAAGGQRQGVRQKAIVWPGALPISDPRPCTLALFFKQALSKLLSKRPSQMSQASPIAASVCFDVMALVARWLRAVGAATIRPFARCLCAAERTTKDSHAPVSTDGELDAGPGTDQPGTCAGHRRPSAVAWMDPEVQTLGADKVAAFIAADAGLMRHAKPRT